MKRFFKSMAAMAMFGLAISATALDAKQVTVVLKHDPLVEPWLKTVVANYEKANPDIKVKLQIIGGAESDYYTKLVLMLKTDTNIDVIFEDSFMLRNDVNAGILAPLPKVKDWNEWSNFFPSLQNAMTLDGQIYALPLSTDTRGLYYNTDIFKKAGIATPWSPKNWEDILSAARTIKEKVKGVSALSFAVGATGEGTSMQTAEMFLYGTNDTLYKDGKWIITSQGLLDSLKFIKTVYQDEKLGPNVAIAINSQYGNKVVEDLAPKQKVAIILDGNWVSGGWYDKHPDIAKLYQMTAMPTEFGQAPGHITMSGGWCLAVSQKSQNKEAALNFIEFALNKNNLLNYVKAVRNLSTRKDVSEMTDYPEALKVATSFLDFAQFRPAAESYPSVSMALQQAVESVATGQLTPEKAMTQYADNVTRAVGKDKVVSLPYKN
ncbi:MAG: extracellular solute-binding protein [Lentisphaerota bacterium]